MFNVNRNNVTLVSHGVIEVNDRFASQIADAEPVLVGAVGEKIPDNAGTQLHLRELLIPSPYVHTVTNSHDWSVARNSVAFCPEKIHLLYSQVHVSNWGWLDGSRAIYQYADKVAAISLSYHIPVFGFLATAAKRYGENGTLFVGHRSQTNSSPVMEKDQANLSYSGVATAISIDAAGKARSNNVFSPDALDQIGIYCANPSTATPLLASAACLLKLFKPDLSPEEIIEVFTRTAKQNLIGPPVLDMLAAVQHVRHVWEPIPEPEPEPVVPEPEAPAPEPEPEPVVPHDTAENELVRLSTPSLLVNGPNQTRGNRREGIDKILTTAGKTLWWDKEASITVSPVAGPVELYGYVTGNDYSLRDLSTLTDGTAVIIFPLETNERHASVFFRPMIINGPTELKLMNKGAPLTQVGQLLFRKVPTTPVMPPKTVFVSMDGTWSEESVDGAFKYVMEQL